MEKAVEHALSGKCLVYPTSTLPALGCIPQPEALDGLFSIKKRSYGSPVSLGVADIEQARRFVEVPPDVLEILGAFPSGSLSIILRCHEELDSRLGGSKLAVRIVSNPIAKELLRRTGPLTATSANVSGEEPLNDCVSAAESLTSRERPVIAVEGICNGGAPSTLIAWHTVCDTPESQSIKVVREGKISSKEIFAWWEKKI